MGNRLARLAGGISTRVKGGPNEGLRWSIASIGRGYGDGTFEMRRLLTLAGLIRDGECVWDIGAHKGYVSLLAARRVGEKGCVYSFEPSQENLWFLGKHLEWNGIRNVTVTPTAVGDFDGESSFGGGSSLSLSLGGGDSIVKVRTIASLIESDGYRPPTLLKIDVEGAEAKVLEGAGKHLFAPDRVIMAAMHSRENHERCTQILRDAGYRLVESGETAEIRARNWTGRGDPDILAIGPEREVSDEALEIFTEV